MSLPCSRALSHLSISDNQHVSSQSSSQLTGQSELVRGDSSFKIDNIKDKKIDIITPEVAAALDRAGITDRNAQHLLQAVASTSFGCNIENINLSRSTIYLKRKKFRKEFASEIKENCQLANCLVVHWDGKLLPEIDGSRIKVDRLPIVVSGLDTEQLLGVPKLESGTGLNQATAIVQALNIWNVADRVKAMCFDTTSSNTGKQ